MEGSEKWLSPSKSVSSPKSPKVGVNDENDSSQANVFPNSHNEKKTAFQHFMSTTVSAASKAAPPRRKILSERDKHSIDSGFQTCKTSYSNKRQSPINSSPDFMDHSSLKAYDPLKNFLSPRPKFLRFNPNRRREIFGRLEKELLSDSSDSQEVDNKEVEDSSFSHLRESFLKPESEDNNQVCNNDGDEKEDNDEEEEEEEEVEEARGWCFRGFMVKFALIFFACAVSTSYICTMNLGTPAPAQQAICGVKDGLFTTKRQTFEMIGVEMWGAGYLKTEAGDNCGEFEEGEFLETNVDWDDQRSLGLEIIEGDVLNLGVAEVEENENRELEGSLELEIVERSDFEISGKDEDDLVGNEKHEDCEGKTDERTGIENWRSGESEVKNENLDKSVNAEIGEGVNAGDSCSSEVVDSSCLALNDNMEKMKAPGNEVEQSTRELADKSENAEKNDLEMVIKAPDHTHELKLSEKTEAAENKIEQSTGRRTGEKEIAEKKDLEKEMKAPDQMHELTISEKIEAVENKIEQQTGERIDESENADKNILEKETTEALDQMQGLEHADKSMLIDNSINNSGIVVQDEESGRKMLYFFKFSVVPIILASLAIAIYLSKKKPRNGSAEKYKPVLDKPGKSAGIDEKRRVEFIARPSMLHHPMEEEEASSKFYHSQIYAPTVELIGEIVVGQPSRRRIRKHEAKSPEEGKAGVCKIEITPVRRSSRLRSRAAIITSP